MDKATRNQLLAKLLLELRERGVDPSDLAASAIANAFGVEAKAEKIMAIRDFIRGQRDTLPVSLFEEPETKYGLAAIHHIAKGGN